MIVHDASLTVVIVCHSSSDVQNTLLFTAQDMNMTNGDYAFFTFGGFPSPQIMKPWLLSANLTLDQLNYRKAAFYAVKQVRSKNILRTVNGFCYRYVNEHHRPGCTI
jgi:hypothetical protein